MKASRSASTVHTAVTAGGEGRQEVRCAVRFPLALPATLSTGKTEFAGQTRNISASGVLFSLDRELDVGPVLGTPKDVLVHCTGRVVRCSLSQHQYLAASTIDEYRFAEQRDYQ
jgi:hypothetical protein